MKLGPVDHITLNVLDMKAAIDFYKKLGMQREGSLDNDDMVMLWNGDEERPLHIQLDQVHGDRKPGLNHIAFTMPDLEEAVKDMKEVGVEGLDGPSYMPLAGRTICTFPGPDGVVLQLARKDARGKYEDNP